MKFLVAVDGSEHSRIAAEQCCQFIADPKNTEMLILAVVPPSAPVMTEHQAVSADYVTHITEDVQEVSKNHVEEAADLIRRRFEESPFKVETKIDGGVPETTIVEQARSFDADLIVVGSHGYGFWERVMSGSVSDSVVHHAPCSVLVVKAKE